MSAHTPGPWRRGIGHPTQCLIHTKVERRFVCCLEGIDTSLPEDNANARLIAAAPELLAALEAFEQGPPDGDNTDRWFAQYAINLEWARAEISKAKGVS